MRLESSNRFFRKLLSKVTSSTTSSNNSPTRRSRRSSTSSNSSFSSFYYSCQDVNGGGPGGGGGGNLIHAGGDNEQEIEVRDITKDGCERASPMQFELLRVLGQGSFGKVSSSPDGTFYNFTSIKTVDGLFLALFDFSIGAFWIYKIVKSSVRWGT